MALDNEQPISANDLIRNLLNVLKPVNRESWIHELSRELGEPERIVPESVGLCLGLIDQVDEEQYVAIRERLNDVFMVGDYPDFNGYVEEDTEFGDITDTFDIIFKEQFSRPFNDGETVSHEVRLQWRNALLEELDEMVAR
ncbi:hypothetical protein HJ167_16425 [Vibrio parahaemolyticus]|uniref:Uncharacterized protein n=1 Tax=Vibrio vulnificus TaxID=672 RepID=A0AAN1PUZ3_VIBVL|nr:hypothetical protein [Vibrio vulnificus]AXX63230.1 hypothetical protein FORC53_4891 [Vibrio vulnificus]MBE4779235.1 hypothetical protein [Vibrio parahaemolyticus]